MRAIAIVVVLGGSVFGLERAYRPAEPAPTPTPTPKPDPTPPGRTWESRTMRTNATSTTAAWRKSSTRPLEVEDRPAVDAQPQALLAEEKETIVFSGKYSPDDSVLLLCSRAPPEAFIALRERKVFEVTEVTKGDLNAKVVAVSYWNSCAIVARPKELKVGTVYSLRLTPSDATRDSLREHQKSDGRFWLNAGDRLAVSEIEFQ
jgi:hypothetical protein